MDNKVKIECLSKAIGNRSLLNNIYFEIETGDIIGLYGNNGSGKSTLLSILFGAIKSDTITLSFNNKVVLSRVHFNKIFSLLPQFKFIPSNISVKKLLHITIETKSLNEILEDKILEEIISMKVSALSTGILRYLETITILYNNSKFCLLDEPFQGLSPILCRELSKHILNKSKTKGIVITDHNYRYISKLANKSYLLHNGSLVPLKNQRELITLGYIRHL